MHLKEVHDQVHQLLLLYHSDFIQKLKQLLLHQVIVENKREQILYQNGAYGQSLINGHFRKLEEGYQVALEVVYDATADLPKVVHLSIRLIYKAVTLILSIAHELLSKVQAGSLTFLEAYRWKVNAISAGLDVLEGDTQWFIVSPERDRLVVKVYESADYVANRPCFSVG